MAQHRQHCQQHSHENQDPARSPNTTPRLIGLTRAILLGLKPVTGMIECLRQLRALTFIYCLACVPHPPSSCSAVWSTALPLEPIYRVLARAVIGLVRSSLQVDHGGSAFGNVFKFDAGHTTAVSSVFACDTLLPFSACAIMHNIHAIATNSKVHGVHAEISMDCDML